MVSFWGLRAQIDSRLYQTSHEKTTVMLVLFLLILAPISFVLASPFWTSTSPLTLSNITLTSNLRNLTSAAHPACNGHTYGYGLTVASCLDALLLFKAQDTRLQSYGNSRIPGQFDIDLPRRYISSEHLTSAE